MTTERDETLLWALESLRYITPRLSVPHFFPSPPVARRRLLRLYRAGSLTRYPTGINGEAIYCLPGTKQPLQIPHLMGALSLWHRIAGDKALLEFHTSYSLDYRYKGDDKTLRPDALISWQREDGEYIYAYEYERTRPPGSFAPKVRLYEEWAEARGWEALGTVPTILVESPKADALREVIRKTQTIKEMRWIVSEDVSGILSAGGPVMSSSVRW